jgi:NADP-dependent 3-hydroxy acid dehydrogenase YdfG
MMKYKLYKANFKNKLVWVTGASSGIGEALAKDFVSAGAHVIITSRNFKELERVKNECKYPD